MKSIRQPQSHGFLYASLLCMLLGTAACSSAPENESNNGVDSTGSETFTAVRNTGLIPSDGNCGYVSAGVDDKGHELVEGEQYAPGLMNENLANNPDLRAITGLETVSTCEDARVYSAGYAAYRQAGLAAEPESAPIAADLPVYGADEVDEPKANLVADGEVSKILNGQLTSKSEVVQFVYYMDEAARSKTPSLYKHYSSCSAVRIAGPLFLTAAHCLNPYLVDKVLTGPSTQFEEMYELNTIEIKYKDSTVKYFRGRCNSTNSDCDLLSAKAYIHPKYTGADTDTDTDLAVIYVEPASQTSLRTAFPAGWTQWYSWLAPQKPQNGQALTLYGWGPVSNTDSNYWKYQQRSLPGLQTIPIDSGVISFMHGDRNISEAGKVTTKHFEYGTYGVTATSTKTLCHGDSGGPAYGSNPDRVLGIASGSGSMPFSTRCIPAGLTINFARTDLSGTWLPTAVRKLQSGEGPLKANTCKCAFVGSSNDPYNSENPGARISCAIGCTDPTLLIQ